MSKALKNKVKLNNIVSVEDFGADPTGVTDSTVAWKAALESGFECIKATGTYKVTSIDATASSSIVLLCYGATLVNTSQVAALGIPILRIRATSTRDVSILGLTITGPLFNL